MNEDEFKIILARLDGKIAYDGKCPIDVLHKPTFEELGPHGEQTTRLFWSEDFHGMYFIPCENHLQFFIDNRKEVADNEL